MLSSLQQIHLVPKLTLTGAINSPCLFNHMFFNLIDPKQI